MHKVNCNECGNVAEVPFKPTGEKPVFCNDCFGGKKETSSRSFDTRFDSRTDRKPAANTSTYSSTPRAESKPDPRIGELKSQVEALNSKMDRIIEMIRKETVVAVSNTAQTKPVVIPTKEVAKKVVAKTVAPVTKVVAKKAPAKKK
jgi:CxxC-x17-CxxC domain-containing protein